MTNGTVSVCCLGLGLRAALREMSEARRMWVLRKFYKFVTSIDEVVHKFPTALFVSVIVGAYASKAKCKAIWNGTFSVGGVA